MAKGIILDSMYRFYWNIEAKVGPGCPNKTEDYQLVQLAFYCNATNPLAPPKPENKPIYDAVVPGAVYTGNPSDPLSIAIKTKQKDHGGVQDGVVSLIHAGGTYAPGTPYVLVTLNNNIIDVLGDDWPWINRHPKCPAALKAAVDRTFRIGAA